MKKIASLENLDIQEVYQRYILEEFARKISFSNNTLIYPEAINNNLQSLFNDEKIKIYTYHIETIIAEKFETTLDRGEFNGRMRDLLDIYFIIIKFDGNIDYNKLSDTIIETSKDRNTLDNLNDYHKIMKTLATSRIFKNNFKNYINIQYSEYNITLEDVVSKFNKIYYALDIDK